jgi:hypothetical protein
LFGIPRALVIGKGDQVVGALAWRLRKHVKADRVVAGKEVDPGVGRQTASGNAEHEKSLAGITPLDEHKQRGNLGGEP